MLCVGVCGLCMNFPGGPCVEHSPTSGWLTWGQLLIINVFNVIQAQGVVKICEQTTERQPAICAGKCWKSEENSVNGSKMLLLGGEFGSVVLGYDYVRLR